MPSSKMTLLRIFLSVFFFLTPVLTQHQEIDGPTDQEIETDESAMVIGGFESLPHSRPYTVLILKEDGKMKGTGVIINPYTILTEGRNSQVIVPGKDRVYAGKHSTTKFELSQQVREVCRFVYHPDYEWTKHIYSYSLVHLSDPLIFNNYVQPIPLAPKGFAPKRNCTFAAWGAEGTTPSEVLNERKITIQPCTPPTATHVTTVCGTAGFCGVHIRFSYF